MAVIIVSVFLVGVAEIDSAFAAVEAIFRKSRMEKGPNGHATR
jgi:hypothetical protein